MKRTIDILIMWQIFAVLVACVFNAYQQEVVATTNTGILIGLVAALFAAVVTNWRKMELPYFVDLFVTIGAITLYSCAVQYQLFSADVLCVTLLMASLMMRISRHKEI